MTTEHIVLHADGDFDFAFALDTYVIYPWIREGSILVRPIRTGPTDECIGVAHIRQFDARTLLVEVSSDDLTSLMLEQIRATLVRCLQLNYPSEALNELAAGDRVLSAALRHRGLGRGKLYPDLFEALCGVVCARRTVFARIYAMMRNLGESFGQRVPSATSSASVHAFPLPADLMAATAERVRACGVGFRGRTLVAIAEYLYEHGYTWHAWASRAPLQVATELLAIDGIGPYTAHLATNLAYGVGAIPHIDSYVTNVIHNLYLDTARVGSEQVANFVNDRWGCHAEYVLDLLTTDTEKWAAGLGKSVGVKSGARG